MAKKQVRVGKIDLDTCGAALLLGVSREDEVVAVRGNASPEDLANAEVICIEVGGSGQVGQKNFDHHAVRGPVSSASLQVLLETSLPSLSKDLDYSGRCGDETFLPGIHYKGKWLGQVSKVVNYIHILDTQGPEALRQRTGGVEFPTLSDVFAGMLLTERNPVEQLHKGIEILRSVAETEGQCQDPFGTIRGFDAYAEAKTENNRQIAKALEQAQFATTQAGRKLGYLVTDFFGAPGALYGVGAEIVVAYSPQFGDPPVPKFTIAGNGIKVDAALPALNALEEGWGGPATGTILGSPRSGSSLTLEQVIEMVKTHC